MSAGYGKAAMKMPKKMPTNMGIVGRTNSSQMLCSGLRCLRTEGGEGGFDAPPHNEAERQDTEHKEQQLGGEEGA